MADFIQGIRISELQNKLAIWTPTKIAEYYGNKPGMALPIPLGFERTDEGYLNANGSSVEFVTIANGDTFKLKPRSDADWSKFTALKALADESGDFRIETPLYREVLSDSLEYIELQAPNREFGSNYGIEMINSNLSTDAAQYAFVSEFVDAVGKILPHLVTAGGSTINVSVFNPMNWWKDSNGSYFTNLDSGWNVSVDIARTVMQNTIDIITSPSGAVSMFGASKKASNETLDSIRSEMEAKWLI